MGRPDTGYSSTSFPPPFYDPSPRPTKRKYGKTNIRKQVKKKKMNNEDKVKTIPKRKENTPLSLPTSALVPPLPEPSAPLPASPSTPTTIPLIIPGSCTQCHTTNTPLWRRGPFGFRT